MAGKTIAEMAGALPGLSPSSAAARFGNPLDPYHLLRQASTQPFSLSLGALAPLETPRWFEDRNLFPTNLDHLADGNRFNTARRYMEVDRGITDPDLWGAAANESFIGSALTALATETPPPDPTFDPTKQPDLDAYPSYWRELLRTRSRAEYDLVLARVRRREEDMKILSQGGVAGFIASNVVDLPLAMLPVGQARTLFGSSMRAAATLTAFEATHQAIVDDYNASGLMMSATLGVGFGILAASLKKPPPAAFDAYGRYVRDPTPPKPPGTSPAKAATEIVEDGLERLRQSVRQQLADEDAAAAAAKAKEGVPPAPSKAPDPYAQGADDIRYMESLRQRSPELFDENGKYIGKELPKEGVPEPGIYNLSDSVRRDLMEQAEGEARRGAIGAQRTPRVDLKVQPALGLENLPTNPFLRIMKTPADVAKLALMRLTDVPGLTLMMNIAGVATPRSAERMFKLNWRPLYLDTMDEVWRLYLNYRGLAPDTGRIRQQVTDTLQPPAGRLTFSQFREEIGKAMNLGDQHAIPEVAAAAARSRQMLDKIKQAADDVRLFTFHQRRALDDLAIQERQLQTDLAAANTRLQQLQGRQPPATRAELNQARRAIVTIQKSIDDIGDNMKALNKLIQKRERIGAQPPKGALSYFPWHYRRDLIMSDKAAFLNDVVGALADIGATGNLRQTAENIFERLTQSRPYDDIISGFRVSAPRSARDRLELPYDRMKRWIDHDIDSVFRYHHTSMGHAIELMRAFPDDLDFRNTLRAVGQELDDLIAQNLLKPNAKKAILDDVQAMHERYLGIYGQPEHPYRLVSRGFRMLKDLNYMAMLGTAVISAWADPGRIIMTEGLRPFFAGFKTMFDAWGDVKLAKKEARAVAEAADLTLSTRANALFDAHDTFGRASKLEHMISRGSAVFSILNGLSWWTDTMKTFASLVIGDRILRDATAWANNTASTKQITKMTRAGITHAEAVAIAGQAQHFKQGKRLKIANSDAWTDPRAREAFLGALSWDVNRTIVTPGVADRANWMSTELGSVISQFKTFAVSSHYRVLMAGLQDRDAGVLQGVLGMVALGALADQMKGALNNVPGNQPVGVKVASAVDRSGILGWFMDVNNGLETLSNKTLGLKPALGQTPQPVGTDRKMGILFGPSGQQVTRAAMIGGDLLDLNPTEKTARMAWRTMPFNNHFGVLALTRAVDQ